MKRLLLALPAVALLATAAVASSDDRVPPGSLTIAEIAGKLSAKGLTVTKIEEDDGRYEAYAVDSSGTRIKMKIDPKTGEVVSQRTRR